MSISGCDFSDTQKKKNCGRYLRRLFLCSKSGQAVQLRLTTMVLGSLYAPFIKVAAAIIIFLLGAFCGLLLIKIYDFLYPPIQVTCWYCNEQSALKARGEETANCWYCRKCENHNVRDEVCYVFAVTLEACCVSNAILPYPFLSAYARMEIL